MTAPDLYLVDASPYIFRAFHALPSSIRDPEGRSANAVLGFAGFLMDSGLRGESLLVPLLGFNLGVEGGQLALLGAFVVLARLAGPRIVWRAAPVAASLLCAIGVYWFVGRSLGS